MDRNAFTTSHQVLLIHWSNHYALIFALREWQPVDGPRIRQILTAKRGQRPTVWANFEEVRESLLGWDGYKIMAICRTSTSCNY
jgi:hypothetical protein